MHLDEEQLQRLLHGALAPVTEASVRAHADRCESCRSRMAQAAREERRVLELLRAIDHPAPQVSVAAIAARARRRHHGWGRRAAAILVALSLGGVAYAAPGSPLPALVGGLLGRGGPTSHAPAPVRPPPEPEVTAGISVVPGERFTIAFAARETSGLATVSLVDGNEIVVRAVGGNPSFASDVDRLSIDDVTGVATFEIEIPRRAPAVEIRVGGRQVLRKTAERVDTDAPRDAGGRYAIRLTPAPPAIVPSPR